MRAALIGIAIAWAFVTFVVSLVLLGEYSPPICIATMVTLFGGGIGFATTLGGDHYG